MLQPNVRTLTSENLSRLNPLRLPLPWLIVVVLIIGSLTVKYSDDDQKTITPLKTVKEFPHVFMANVDMRDFDANGALHYQLKTPLIRHFQAKGKTVNSKTSDLDYTLFDLPQIVFLGDAQNPAWYITAQQARNDSNGDLFTLSTDVLAQQTSPTQGVISITTTELRLNTREQFAETDKAVTMRSAKTTLNTIGMRADIKQDQIQLISHVTGTYEP